MTSTRLKELISLVTSQDVIRRDLRDNASVLRVYLTPIHWIDLAFRTYSDEVVFEKADLSTANGIGTYPQTETWLANENLTRKECIDISNFFVEQRNEIYRIRSLHSKLDQDSKVNIALIYKFRDKVKEFKCNQTKG